MEYSKTYQSLIQKIDQFIRKYYWNQLIKGSLLTLGLNLFTFLIFNILESQFYFGTTTRKVLFYGMVLILGASIYHWIAQPLIKYLKLGNTLSHEEAATIIGTHFSEVSDKLLNVLHLAKQSESSNNDLLFHSIEQKTNEINWVPFPNAIDLQKNKKYLKYALPPVLILIALLFSAPSIITQSSYRLIHNNKEFTKAAPFQFQLENESLKIPQFEDITIHLSTTGHTIPSETYIVYDGYQYKMKSENNGQFHYTIKNIGSDIDFKFLANGFHSLPYSIDVIEKPTLLNLAMDIDYPSYTGMQDKTIKNPSNLTLPEGSKVNWIFDTDNMSFLQLKSDHIQGLDTLIYTENNTASYVERIFQSGFYTLNFNNENIPNADSIHFQIDVIKDQHPKIELIKQSDSLSQEIIYNVGEISDDYGIQSLIFQYAIVDENHQGEIKYQQEILGTNYGKAGTYNKVIDLSEVNLLPGQSLQYFFEVWDNDAINGSKSSKTAIETWTEKTKEEFKALEEANEDEIKDNLNKILSEQQKLKEASELLKNKLFQERNLEWQHKKEIEKLVEQQKELQKKLEQTQNLHEQNQKNQEKFKENQDQNTDQINELLEQAKNPEMEELLNKIQELMQKMKKEEAVEMLEQMNQQMNQSEMDMQRLKDLYEKLEMESDVQDALDELNKLAEEQEKLAEENLNDENDSSENIDNEQENSERESSNDNDANSKENEEKQQQLNEDFEKLSKELQELFEENKDLKNPLNLDDPKTPSEEIKREQQQAQENLQKNQKQQAGQKQKNAAQKMKEMQQSMENNMSGSQQQQMQEDLALLRQILDNLVKLSFNQEGLIEEISEVSTATPKYVSLVQEQFKLKNDFGLIQDSLLALANRNADIQTAVTDKVNLIDQHLDQTIDLLEERDKNKANNDQRRAMKNINDLALLLSESMENMQMSMSNASAMCQDPQQSGQSGNVPMDKIKEGQQQLSEEMQKLAKERQGEGKGQKMSKEFAQIAAQQAALRKMLEEKQQNLRQQGKGSKELQELIDMMDQMEYDLVNKKLTNEMMKRQQEILTKLLEAEKAERQQELDEKRKSDVAKQLPKTLPSDLEEYLKQRREEISPYKKLSPALKPYYKRLVEEYYNQLKTD